MAELFFSSAGVKAFYATMCLYLYGDLMVYAVAVPKSLVSVACPSNSTNTTCLGSLDNKQAYYVFLVPSLGRIPD